jgi:hypothetical protein
VIPVHRAALVAALFAFLPPSASAQWQGSIGAGARRAIHTEVDLAGQQLVREDGWLPGASLRGAYRHGSLSWTGGVDWYQGDLDYRGRTQAGAAAASATSTRLASAGLGASYALGEAFGNVHVLAALEIDRWQRDIIGTAAGAGLQETYRSRRQPARSRPTPPSSLPRPSTCGSAFPACSTRYRSTPGAGMACGWRRRSVPPGLHACNCGHAPTG